MGRRQALGGLRPEDGPDLRSEGLCRGLQVLQRQQARGQGEAHGDPHGDPEEAARCGSDSRGRGPP